MGIFRGIFGKKEPPESESSRSPGRAAAIAAANLAYRKDYAQAEKAAKRTLKIAKDVFSRHSAYLTLADLYYKQRDTNPEAIDLCIKYSLEHVKVMPRFVKWFRREYGKKDPLPTVTPHERLAIIYEKRGDIQLAIAISEKAKKLGYPQFQKRIDRLKKKK